MRLRESLLTTVSRTCLALPLALDEELYSNHLYLLALLTLLLTVANSGARWSLDARRRGSRPLVLAWPVVLIQARLPIVYGFAALAKVNIVYLSGGVLAGSLRTEVSWQHRRRCSIDHGRRRPDLGGPRSLSRRSVPPPALASGRRTPGRWLPRQRGRLHGASVELVIFGLAMVALYPLLFPPCPRRLPESPSRRRRSGRPRTFP